MTNRRLQRTAALAAAVAAVALIPSSARTAPHAPPLIIATPHELRVARPVTSLAADNGRAAFTFCNQLNAVWHPGATGVVRLGPLNLWSCPPPTGVETIQTLAIANDRIAWALDESGNLVDNYTFVTTLAHPHTLTLVANLAHCCRGEPDEERMGYVYGDKNFLAFGTRYKCGDNGPGPCGPGAPGGFVNYSAWRIRRPPFSAPCAYTTGPCEQIASSNGTLEPLSVDSGRVVLRDGSGTLIVRAPSGLLVRTFPALAGLTRGAELMGNRLIVLIPGHILDLSLTTGHQLHSRLVPHVPSAGVCGIRPCAPTALRMVDASRGLVAYTLAGKLHLLRLRDGTNRVVASATDARFGDTGLFYTHTATGPYPGRIRFVPWQNLPVRP